MQQRLRQLRQYLQRFLRGLVFPELSGRLLRRQRQLMGGGKKGWGRVPHLFAKATVVYCIAFASGTSLYALRILARTGHDPAALLGIILAFFGGELLLLCLKTIFKNKEEKNGMD